MNSFATLPARERALYWRNYANRSGVPEFIVEKDFWVCWLLGRIFATPQLGVRLHKIRFFASGWAHYETAVPGTLRIAPPDFRLAELRRDYAAMQPMFLSPPPDFETILATLRAAEGILNGRSI